MVDHVDLKRRFRILKDEELEDPETLAEMNKRDHGFGWAKTLRFNRVVLLAEAGAGKTWEMREQADRPGKDSFAIFVPLESLAEEVLEDLLLPPDGERSSDRK